MPQSGPAGRIRRVGTRTGSIRPGVVVHGTDNAHTVLIDAVL